MQVPEPPLDPNGHEYVEIGGIKWATMNVGATSITDVGLLFQWGDTQGYTASQVGSGTGKKYFGTDDYSVTKYNTIDNKMVLDIEDDAVRTNWGGDWRMPTLSEFEQLLEATTYEWIENYQSSGENGILLTDKIDSSKKLFFPTSGNADNGILYSPNTEGGYWSSSRAEDQYSPNDYACRLMVSSPKPWKHQGCRYIGQSVRGVLAK